MFDRPRKMEKARKIDTSVEKNNRYPWSNNFYSIDRNNSE
jgi:hypothetical protein